MDTVRAGISIDIPMWSSNKAKPKGPRQNVDPEDGDDEVNLAEIVIEKMMQPSQQKSVPPNQKMVVKVSSSLFIS